MVAVTLYSCPLCNFIGSPTRYLLGGLVEIKCLTHGKILVKPEDGIPTKSGAQLRDEALEAVDDPPWKAFALQALEKVARRQDELSSEDVWEELEIMGIPKPSEGRAMGPVLMAAVKSGWIIPDRYEHATNPKHHAMPKRIYRSALS